MPIFRRNAIVELVLPSISPEDSMPLTCEREYGVFLTIDGCRLSAQSFRSPVNDERWRDFIKRMSECNTNHKDTGYESAVVIRAIGRDLFQSLAALNPALQTFLASAGVPRRLVIQTKRPELHLLPWGALYDISGKLLAAGDLSVVQAWHTFAEVPLTLAGTLNLVSDLDADTGEVTGFSMKKLPPEITREKKGAPDIVHLEKHGNNEMHLIGGVTSTTMAKRYAKAKLALLWSCYSGSANSWGQSPALSLHREGVPLVLSFQSELNNLDAASIAQAFYSDVFGAAASRDPETALVRIRVAKFEKEFECANWASMMVYLQSPLDLSAMPLNGPRVPAAQWLVLDPKQPKPPVDPRLKKTWRELTQTITELSPGTITGRKMPETLQPGDLLRVPASIAEGWRGNVIRLDGGIEPLSNAAISEVGLQPRDAPAAGAPDRLMWFFGKIASFGAPLVLWFNASLSHLEFLKTIAPPSTLTFLLLYEKPPALTVPELVDMNLLEEAQKVYEATVAADCPTDLDDEIKSAAYFAYSRCGNQAAAELSLLSIKNPSEKALLTGNYISRYRSMPGEAQATGSVPQSARKPAPEPKTRHNESDCYRDAIRLAAGDTMLRDTGRARKELAYFMQERHRLTAAEIFYRAALTDLERCTTYDIRWHAALASLLRDWADLMAGSPDRLDDATKMLQRALAIHAFHGRRLQIAYSLATKARIFQTAGKPADTIEIAIDAANLFEQCGNWGGWSDAIRILLEALAETRETTRMLSIIQLALAKVQVSKLPPAKRDGIRRTLIFEEAKANWIRGDVAETRRSLDNLFEGAPKDFTDSPLELAASRLKRFVTV